MPTLVPQNADGSIGPLLIQPGVNTLGRIDSNSHVLAHPSVSSRHCEILFDGSTISIRDLGSTNGTYIDGELVTEAPAIHGQKIRIGSMDFTLDAPELAAPKKTASLRVNVVPATPVQTVPMPMGQSAAAAIASLPELQEEPGFYRRIPGSFAYPFRKSGVIMLVIGALFFLVIEFVGRFSFYLSVFGAAYLFAFMQKVISHSAQGEDEMPPWPELTDMISDIVLPCLMLVACFAIAIGPGLALLFFSGDNPGLAIAGWTALGLGAIYLPMALLAVAVSDNFLALSPHIVAPSIVRLFVPYTVTFIVVAFLVAIRYLADATEAMIPREAIAARISHAVAMGFVSLYFLTVEMRILGLFFRSYREKLGWLG